MLAKKYKLRGHVNEDFFVGAQVWNCHWGRIFFRVREARLQKNGWRVAVITPKKYLRESVRRHLVKRHTYEAVKKVMNKDKWYLAEIVISTNSRFFEESPEKIVGDLEFFASHKLRPENEEKCGKIEEIDTKKELL